MKRKILSADVTMVSLCKRGANTLRTLYKSEGARLMAMVKAASTFEEKGELLAVVAAPGLVDSDGDVFASDEAISQAAHGFMRHGAQLDIQHNLKPLGKDKAHVAESFIIQKGDARFADWKDYAGRAVDVSGGWGMLVKIDDPELRRAYSAGEWDGVSLFAPDFEAEPLAKGDADLAAALRSAFAAVGLTKDSDEENDSMKPEDMQTLAKTLADAVVAAIKPATKPESETSDETIAFEGDPTNKADLAKHAAKLRRAALVKSGDLNDPAKVEALVAQIQAAEKDPKAEREDLRKSQPDLAAALDAKDAAEARIKALQKSSNQTPADDTKPEPSAHPLVRSGLAKASDVPFIAAGLAAARELNEARGRSAKAS